MRNQTLKTQTGDVGQNAKQSTKQGKRKANVQEVQTAPRPKPKVIIRRAQREQPQVRS